MDHQNKTLEEFDYNSGKEYLSLKLLNLFVGYMVCLFTGTILLIFGLVRNVEELGAVIIIGAALVLISSVFSIILLYNLWSFIEKEAKVHGINTPVSTAGRAVGFLFIPIFNFYWVFMAMGKLPTEINRLSVSRSGKNVMPGELGLFVATFTLIALIPGVGLIFGLVNGLILLPILYRKAISAIDGIPYGMENVAIEAPPRVEPLEVSRVNDYSQLFDKERYGINIFFGLYFFVACLLLPLTTRFIVYLFQRSFSFWEFLTGIQTFTFPWPHLFFAMAVLIFSHSVKNKWVLAMIVGASDLFVELLSDVYIVSATNIKMEQFFTNPSLIFVVVSNFFFWFLLILALSTAIKRLGLSFWSILIAVTAAALPANFIMFGAAYVMDGKVDVPLFLILVRGADLIIYTISIYFAFYHYVKRTKSFPKNR